MAHPFRLVILMITIAALLSQCTQSSARGNRKPTTMDDKVYQVILSLVQGTFSTPVRDRTKTEKTAIIHHYRCRGRWGITINRDGQPMLLLDGAIVVSKSHQPKVITDQFHQSKGLGPRRLQQQICSDYVGLSEPAITSELADSTLYRRLNMRFSNKAPLKAVTSQQIMGRVQIDLVDFSSHPAMFDKKEYRYILTVMDTFSRFMWMRPLQRKSSKHVAIELKEIFDTFGNPKICQSDQGPEFKSSVSHLLRTRNIQEIHGSPYHPQSQGKIERAHRTLKKKMQYDLVTSDNGTNWVEQLLSYQTLLNDMKKLELKWRSPFQVFFGRSRDLNDETDGNTIRQDALVASKVASMRMIARSEKALRTPTYFIGDRVYVRLRKGNKKLTKMHVAKGKVVDRKLERYMYQVSYSANGKMMIKWFSVKDITGRTMAMQKERHKNAPSCYQPTDSATHNQTRPNDFSSPVTYNPPGDGSCQFAAMSHAMASIGIHRSHTSLRDEVTNYLQNQRFLGVQETVNWTDTLCNETSSQYLQRMGDPATFGDHRTLQAMSELFNIQILVNSTIAGGSTLITPAGLPVYESDMPTFILGHYDENQGLHYVVLRNQDQDIANIVNNSMQIRRQLGENQLISSCHRAQTKSNSKIIVTAKKQSKFVTKPSDFDQPASDQPESTQPASNPPASDPPASDQPASDPPASDQSASAQPASDPPASDPPTSDPPASDPPASDPPASDPPASDPSASDQSASAQPASDPPASVQPASDPPASDPPASDPPASDQSASAQPASDPPASVQPASDPPASDPPASDPPASDPPVLRQSVANPAASDQLTSDRLTSGHLGAEQSATGQSTSGQSVCKQSTLDQPSTRLASLRSASLQSASLQPASLQFPAMLTSSSVRNRSLRLALPEELKVIIFGLAVKGDIITHRNLQTVCMDIRQILHDFNLTPGPQRIYFSPSSEDAFNPSRLPELGISVRKLSAQFGRGSGLMLEIREILRSARNWINAWLVLRTGKYGWYTIVRVYWKTR